MQLAVLLAVQRSGRLQVRSSRPAGGVGPRPGWEDLLSGLETRCLSNPLQRTSTNLLDHTSTSAWFSVVSPFQIARVGSISSIFGDLEVDLPNLIKSTFMC